MQRYRTAFLGFLLVTGCSGTHDATTDSPAAAAEVAAESAAPAEATSGSGTGHLHLTGGTSLDADFVVDGCQIGPAGDGLLSGYRMTVKDAEPIVMVSVALKNYTSDGTYSPADKSDEGQVAGAMTSGVMGPLTLMVKQPDSDMPLALMLKPASKLDVQISDGGVKGDAEFTDMETPPTMEDMQAGGTPHGKKVSGSVTWSCGKVDRLDPKMNAAVNGMFKGLIPSAQST